MSDQKEELYGTNEEASSSLHGDENDAQKLSKKERKKLRIVLTKKKKEEKARLVDGSNSLDNYDDDEVDEEPTVESHEDNEQTEHPIDNAVEISTVQPEQIEMVPTVATLDESQEQPLQEVNLHEENNWKMNVENLRKLKKEDTELHSLRKRVRQFYEKQNEAIDGYVIMDTLSNKVENAKSANTPNLSSNNLQDIAFSGQTEEEKDQQHASNTNTSNSQNEEEEEVSIAIGNEEEDDEESMNFRDKLAVRLSFWANVLLFILKLVASILSLSLSIITSTLDSSLDLLSGAILYFTNSIRRRKLQRDVYHFPIGKARFEPLGFIVFASVMSTASCMIMLQGVVNIITGVNDNWINPPTEAVLQCLSQIPKNWEEVTKVPFFFVGIGVMSFTILLKFVLFLICKYLSKAPSAHAYAMDHRNDVLSNTVLIICLLLSHYVPFLWFMDAIGAICLSIFIVQSWMRESWEHIRKLVGKNASPEFLNQITYLAYNHHPAIQKIDTVSGFFIGEGLFVEVDIVMDADTKLKEAHDIGESLQKKIEKIANVERAYIHLDYEYEHRKDSEHKRIK